MAVKFHINPETKNVGECSAKSPESCRFSVSSGAVVAHYETREAAEAKIQEDLSKQYGTLTAKTKSRASSRNDSLKFEDKSIEEIISFADKSFSNYQQLNKLINDRSEKTRQRLEVLKRAEDRKLIDDKTLKSHKRDLEDYRNRTAELVEAYSESRFLNDSFDSWNGDKVGEAVRVHSYPALSRGWYENRYNTVGGSDVGTLVEIENNDNPKGYVFNNYKKIIKSKTVPVSEDSFKDELKVKAGRVGALYRGTVWEKKIVEDYAKDHPNRKVYFAEGQFAHPQRSWQQINIDGLVSDRADGVPNGILEIKTGSDASQWSNGVPQAYRAQTLYYLNTTGLEFADVRALINDSEVYEYRLNKNDDVVEGSGEDMETYIQNRVSPWFEDLKKQRSEIV